ncbi:L,D-transpeptidase family protein [Luteolibacter ambystomatis]|uniref:L,D-transpeptidase family protein n=1 Tax=Luteolibacter ambystomatis TaxID=2824561 RepID=UPI001CF7C46E|nr:murein L,D-transpeptidase family protein [Luteolibacter ambystomatis]
MISPEPSSAAGSVASDLPGPERASAAAARVQPELKKALAAKGLHLGDPVFIRVFKEERTLELWVRRRDTRKYDLFRSWPVAAMSGVLGPKLQEGDAQAPEGFYFVPPERMKPDSQFHLAFNIGYPNAYDLAHDRTGTFLMVHGNEVSIGCFAMTDPAIEEIYTLCAAALDRGQPFFRVHCFPFRMTSARMAAAVGDPWEDFWKNLKEGYDRFEADRVPPDVMVEGKRYVIRSGNE